MEVHQHLAQRLAGRGDDRRVKSVADRQRPYVIASLQEDLHGLFDCFAGAADDRLLPAVYVGDHNVAVNGLQYSLDFSKRRKDGRHLSGVFHRHARHAATAGTDGSQCVLEGERAGCNQGAVFAQAMSHGHVGLDAVSGQQTGQSQVDGQDGGLSDLGLAQIFFGLRDGVLVGLVNEDELAQRLAE